MKYSSKLSMALVTSMVAFTPIQTWAQNNVVSLFQALDQTSVIAADDEALSLVVEGDPSVVSVQVGTIDTDALGTADGLSIALPGAGAFDSGLLEKISRQVTSYSLFSTGDAGAPETSIVVDGDDVVGTISSDGKDYRIVPLGDGRHALIEVNLSELDDHPEGFEEEELPSFQPDQSLQDESGALEDRGREIDVIVAYTNRARVQAGNINALIQLSVDNANRSYRNSGINTRLELVQTYQTSYTESSSMRRDRDRFRISGDGFMDEVHSRRNTTRADVAVLMIGSGSGCGIASAILANSQNAFAVSRQNCSAGNLTFAHEIGHLQGARHNPEADDSSSPFSYGHGFCNDPANWRTVMSYNSGSRCPSRRQVWSGPNARHAGQATGDATLRDNVRVLNGTAPLVANFRSENNLGCRSGFAPAGSRLCITANVAAARTFANAETFCKDRRARVANYGDLRYLYVRTALDAAYNPSGRWIGNTIDDDRALCGNRSVTSDNDGDIANFEGSCNRFDNRRFWCAYDR